MKKMSAIMTGVAALALLMGCAATHESAEEVDCTTQCFDGTNTRVIRNPAGFRNVLMTCDGTTGLYVTSRGNDLSTPVASDLVVIINDPRCVNISKPSASAPTASPSVPQ